MLGFSGDPNVYGRVANGCKVRNSVIEAISVNVCRQRKRTFPPEFAVWLSSMSANPRRPVI